MKLLAQANELQLRREFGFFEDWLEFASGGRWTSLAADAGSSVACGTTTNTGGILTLTTGATLNNEAAVATTNNPFLLAGEKPLLFETNMQYAEGATNKMNICAGFSSVMNTADMLQDSGAGPAASFSGAIIYKLAGQTLWSFRTSVGSTSVDTLSQHTAGGTASQVLRIEIRQGQAGAGGLEAVPFLNGQQMLDANNKPIKQIITYTSALAMQAGMYAKAGSGTSEVATMDYLTAYALR